MTVLVGLRGIELENSMEFLGRSNVVIAEQIAYDNSNSFYQFISRDKEKLSFVEKKLKEFGIKTEKKYNPMYPEVNVISARVNRSDVMDLLADY